MLFFGLTDKIETVLNFHKFTFNWCSSLLSSPLLSHTIHPHPRHQGKIPGQVPWKSAILLSLYWSREPRRGGFRLLLSPHSALPHLILLPRQCSTSTAILFQLENPPPLPLSFPLASRQSISLPSTTFHIDLTQHRGNGTKKPSEKKKAP